MGTREPHLVRAQRLSAVRNLDHREACALKNLGGWSALVSPTRRMQFRDRIDRLGLGPAA
jgi:hypothetical protein